MKILHATDFSTSAKMAIPTLTALNQATPVDLHLVHVVTAFWKDWLTSGLYEKEGMQRLQAWESEIINEGYRDATLHIKKGNASDEVIVLAKEIHADMIVIGADRPKGRKNFSMTGSTAAAIVRHARQSVWLCKSEETKRILCAVDGSDASRVALNKAIELTQHLNASLCVMSVLPKANFNPLGMDKMELVQEEEKFKEAKMGEIDEFLKKFDFKNLKPEHMYPWGVPSRTIMDIAEDFNYDLIVVGSKGHTRLEEVTMGSTAERILRAAPCSLLVVR